MTGGAAAAAASRPLTAHSPSDLCRATSRPWLEELKEYVPSLGGSTQSFQGRTVPKFFDSSEDVNSAGVRTAPCSAPRAGGCLFAGLLQLVGKKQHSFLAKLTTWNMRVCWCHVSIHDETST